jgi:hypothetical protein
MHKKSILLSLIILLSMCNVVSAQSHEKLLSVFIYNFAINSEWAGKDESSDFIIGVLNAGPDGEAMAAELQAMASLKTVGKRKITILEFKKESDVKDCHVLFIPESKSSMLTSLTSRIPSTSTLIVTEKAGLAKLGSCINFIRVDGKLRYEVNTQELDRRNIKISSKITSLAVAI